MQEYGKTVDNVSKYFVFPKLRNARKECYGPGLNVLKQRFLIGYGISCLLGVLPLLVHVFTGNVSAKLVASALGLLVPGGGCVASGNLILMGIGAYICYLTFTIAFARNTRVGDKSWVVVLWLLGMLGGLFAKQVHWAAVLACFIMSAAVIYHFYQDDKEYKKRHDALREEREKIEEDIDSLYQKYTSEEREYQRELTFEQLKAERMILDITNREFYDFEGIEMPKWSANEFRYQMCYSGYGLMMIQKRFTPNFRGYSQHSMQYIIESFTSHEACEYWNTETVGGNFSLDFDPISPRHHDNIMLKGWIAPIIMGYHALYGDDKYNQEGALKFRPFKNHPEKSYDYSVDDIVKVLQEDWKAQNLTFIPCEPNLVFPVCNAYPMIGVEIYDNDFDTEYARSIYEKYMKALTEEFMDSSGTIANRRNNLIGYNWYPYRNFDDRNNFGVLPMMNAIYPGLARRNYTWMRREALSINENGEALLYGQKLENLFDFTNKRNKGGLIIGSLEQCAAEFGDWEMYDALNKAEKVCAPISKNPFKLEYDHLSFVNAVCMVVAKWAQKNDWFDLTHGKVAEAAIHGPLLQNANYPDVLVARAVSDGSDLSLVLYPGVRSSLQTLELSQLKAEQVYVDEIHPEIEFRADKEGRAKIEIDLNGRVELHLVEK